MENEKFSYDNAIVRSFIWATILWGAVAIIVGLLAALQLAWPVFNLNLDYVNSGSSKYLLGLFRVFKKYHSNGFDIEINWFYEEDDEAIESLGEHYLSILHMPFNMKEYI